MRIRVKLFAILREKAGMPELDLELPEGSSASAAAEAVAARLPALREPMRRAALAVNQTYANGSTVLGDGDELALIPPVSGG